MIQQKEHIRRFKSYCGERKNFVAKITKFGFTTRGIIEPTVLLTNVIDTDNPEELSAQHVWIKAKELGKDYKKLYNKTITFSAIIGQYFFEGFNNKMTVKYNLQNIKDINIS